MTDKTISKVEFLEDKLAEQEKRMEGLVLNLNALSEGLIILSPKTKAIGENILELVSRYSKPTGGK